MQRLIRTIRAVRYNIGPECYYLSLDTYPVQAVDPDGSIVLTRDWRIAAGGEVHIHPSEFVWVEGNYLEGELTPQPQEIPMATTTEAPNRPRKKAKAADTNGEQKEFDGEGFPEKPPKKVIDACRALRQAIMDKTAATNAEKESRASLLEKMTEAGLERVKVDDKIYEVNHDDTIKVKAVKGDEGEVDAGA